ncbi:MAG: metallopeptidase TldD-related protein [Bacilli bacterium]
MIEKIKKLLNSNSKINAWKINYSEIKSCELFYVLKNLEINRATEDIKCDVTIYHDFDKYRGSSTIAIEPFMDENDIKKEIDKAVYRASFVKDEYYDIPSKSNDVMGKISSNFPEKSLNEWAKLITDAVFKADVYKNGWINSTEIFLYDTKNICINSNGVFHEYKKYSGMIEVIPTWSKNKEEFELYKNYEFAEIDLARITSEVNEILLQSRDRSEAIKLPKGTNVKVLLSGRDINSFFSYFANQLQYATVYQKMSMFELNKSCQGKSPKGDKLNMKMSPFVLESSSSSPIDFDGIILKDELIIKDGICQKYWGNQRFGYYLNQEKPTGMIPNMVVEGGSKSLQEMKKEPYLECVAYSGLQVDPFTGYVGGEVRLAYYFDGEKTYPVTGLSISGDLEKIKESMFFSKEIISRKNYSGPSHIEVPCFKIL